MLMHYEKEEKIREKQYVKNEIERSEKREGIELYCCSGGLKSSSALQNLIQCDCWKYHNEIQCNFLKFFKFFQIFKIVDSCHF